MVTTYGHQWNYTARDKDISWPRTTPIKPITPESIRFRMIKADLLLHQMINHCFIAIS